MYDLEGLTNRSVFPGLQGGPHNHTISALATALKQVASSSSNVPGEGALELHIAKAMTSRVTRSARRHRQPPPRRPRRAASTQAAAPRVPSRRASFASTASTASSPSAHPPSPPLLLFPGRASSRSSRRRTWRSTNTVPGDKSAFIPAVSTGTPALTSCGFEEAHFDEARRARNWRKAAHPAQLFRDPSSTGSPSSSIAASRSPEVNCRIGELADFKAPQRAPPMTESSPPTSPPCAVPCVGFDETTMKYKDV